MILMYELEQRFFDFMKIYENLWFFYGYFLWFFNDFIGEPWGGKKYKNHHKIFIKIIKKSYNKS